MSALILHHYSMSPFSQKIRSMLGYAGLDWESVVIREMPPRPHLEKLAGGYRKVPVAQIGADVFCDSRTIATEIARLSGKPELALENCDREVQEYVTRVDLDLFFACLFSSATKKLSSKVWKSMSAQDIGRFALDRIKMGRKASVKKITPKQGKAMLIAHLEDLESRLTQDFIFGAEPNHADFSTYHSLWFSRDLAETSYFETYPKVSAWMDRMKAFGEAGRTEITADQSLEVARDSLPRELPEDGVNDPLVGTLVSVQPSDYAKDQSTGRLVGSYSDRWVISREDDSVGTVNVHFPKQGYSLVELH